METTAKELVKIGERLKELRIKAGFTREQVARAVDTCEKTIWCHETAKTGIAYIWLMGYAVVYGTAVEEVLKGTDWVKPGK